MLDSIPSKGSLVSIEGVSSTLPCVISLDLRVASVVKKQCDDNGDNWAYLPRSPSAHTIETSGGVDGDERGQSSRSMRKVPSFFQLLLMSQTKVVLKGEGRSAVADMTRDLHPMSTTIIRTVLSTRWQTLGPVTGMWRSITLGPQQRAPLTLTGSKRASPKVLPFRGCPLRWPLTTTTTTTRQKGRSIKVVVMMSMKTKA